MEIEIYLPEITSFLIKAELEKFKNHGIYPFETD